MKKINKSKVIIPALALIALTTAASVTGTAAWFAANTTASVTGMTIGVKSDNTYLLAGITNDTTAPLSLGANDDATITNIRALNNGGVMNIATDVHSLLPSSPCDATVAAKLVEDAANYKTVDGATISTSSAAVTNAATAAVETNWYTATGAGVGASTIKTNSEQQITEAKFANYVFTQDFYFTVAAGSLPAYNLTVTPTFGGAADTQTALSVLMVSDDNAFVTITSTNNGNPVDIKGTNTPISTTTLRKVTAYVFIDGDATTIFTNNSTNLSSATINFTFHVDVQTA